MAENGLLVFLRYAASGGTHRDRGEYEECADRSQSSHWFAFPGAGYDGVGGAGLAPDGSLSRLAKRREEKGPRETPAAQSAVRGGVCHLLLAADLVASLQELCVSDSVHLRCVWHAPTRPFQRATHRIPQELVHRSADTYGGGYHCGVRRLHEGGYHGRRGAGADATFPAARSGDADGQQREI